MPSPAPQLTFASDLAAPAEPIWEWITSLRGINAELHPLMRMTAPAHVSSLSDAGLVVGRPLFRTWVLLFGVLPVDSYRVTLVEIDAGRGFAEESRLLTMSRWRHERRLSPLARPWRAQPALAGSTRLTDTLTFEPRLAAPAVRMLIDALFRHRHRVLLRTFGQA